MGAPTNANDTNGTSTPAIEQDSLVIPLIDIGPFLSPSTPQPTRLSIAHSILHAFRTSGFLYLTNHGIPPTSIAAAFSQSADFFARGKAEKDALAWTTPESNRGYTSMGREKVSQGADKDLVAAVRDEEGEDLKESFEIGREGEGEGRENAWPGGEKGERFKGEMLAFHERCKGLHVQVMRALALGLGIDEAWFDSYTDAGDNTLRLLHYPAVGKSVFQVKKGQVRAGAHSDYGSLTLLFQDQRGGLQVKSPEGTFVDAKPVEGAIVVNAGDLLARWSNDVIKSTVHRVVEPPAPETGDEHPARYSIAYFCNPNFDRWIDVIPSTVKEGEQKKYEGVNSGEYLVKRLTATY